ncbi:hypothetical protein CVT26_004132 [Gymnopilus dilepis]|uniref:Uncharacterized protein n=1 Tax=Gymnopilus dilepis TaxID=231916 RepID=A0A409YVE9_9AGAR|nr:hypothetical protein CVT26_004132 [Gymnopilus dilepis]
MPESKEGTCSGLQCDHFVQNTQSNQREVRGLWHDTTNAEGAASASGSLAREGHVHPLLSSSSVLRGQNKQQTGIFPPAFASPDDVAISRHRLVLTKAVPSPRNVFLCFKYPKFEPSESPEPKLPTGLNWPIDADTETATNDESESDCSDDEGDEGDMKCEVVPQSADENPGSLGCSDTDCELVSGDGQALPVEQLGVTETTTNSDPLKQVKTYWLQVQFLKHTSVQIFTRDEWTDAICKVPKTLRGFKVGLAIEFKEHVLAFLTLDLLVQFHWAPLRSKLPAQQANIYTHPRKFMKELVDWMKERRFGKPESEDLEPKEKKTPKSKHKENKKVKLPTRNGLAIAAIRNTTSIFSGCGLYTMSEVFHKAGLPLSLTEKQLFDNPSRTARLVSAFLDFSIEGYEETWNFMKPFFRGFLLTCHRTERMLYAKTLKVYGKDRVHITGRFKDLLNMYKSCSSESDECFDVFEPNYIQRAIARDDVVLGSLIFGHDVWLNFAKDLGEQIASDPFKPNALTRYFSGPDFKGCPNFLSLEHYTTLFVQDRETAWVPTLYYRNPSTKDLWTVLPITSDTRSMELIEGSERKKHLLSNATQHTEVFTVGPLDFCGVAERLTGPGGIEIVMPCKLDPRQTAFFQHRQLIGAEAAKLRGKGLAKAGLDNAQRRKIQAKLSKAPPQLIPAKRSAEHDDKENQLVCPKKRCYKKNRQSADRDIMASLTFTSRVRASRNSYFRDSSVTSTSSSLDEVSFMHNR